MSCPPNLFERLKTYKYYIHYKSPNIASFSSFPTIGTASRVILFSGSPDELEFYNNVGTYMFTVFLTQIPNQTTFKYNGSRVEAYYLSGATRHDYLFYESADGTVYFHFTTTISGVVNRCFLLLKPSPTQSVACIPSSIV